jgi:hypothetical protein
MFGASGGEIAPHTAGEKLFVDFAGHTMEVVDGATGEIQMS